MYPKQINKTKNKNLKSSLIGNQNMQQSSKVLSISFSSTQKLLFSDSIIIKLS